MESILAKVFSFIAIIAVGYALKRIGFFKPNDFGLISNLVLKVTLPCAVISNFSRIDIEFTLFTLVLIGVACNLITIAFGLLLSKRGDSQGQAFNMINFSGYNIGCFAFPFLQSFVGPVGIVATSIWDTGNAIMCTGATYSIAAAVAGKDESTGGVRLFLKRMFSSVPMDVYLVMTALALLQIKLPKDVLVFTDLVGAANPFLAMLMVGIGFELKLDPGAGKQIFKTLLARYVISAVLAWFFFNYLPFEYEVRKVLAIVSFAPLSVVCTYFTALCLKDPQKVALSCTLNSISIITSIIFMTALIMTL